MPEPDDMSKATGARRALCVGINDYPYDGSDLNGCVNDSVAWANLLKDHFGFSTAVIHDTQATKANMMSAVKKLAAGTKKGDIIVFTNSSHGSYKADTSGDEPTYDEILCPYDISDNDISDDELREIFSNLPAGVSCAVILDNCFSGTATRAAVNEIIPGLRTPDDRRVRFLSPALRGGKVLENPWAAKPKAREKYPQSKMKEVLLSGCTDREYSYDALIGGTYRGAMSYYAIKAIESANYKLTWRQLHARLTQTIEDYPQHPQLEGSSANLKRQVFAASAAGAAV